MKAFATSSPNSVWKGDVVASATTFEKIARTLAAREFNVKVHAIVQGIERLPSVLGSYEVDEPLTRKFRIGTTFDWMNWNEFNS